MEQARAIKEGLAPWKKSNFAMNTMKSSSIALFSYYNYSCALELDYSFHIIILTYQLAYSLYVMILTCSTLCLTIHMAYMSRSRARDEVVVHRSFGFANILAYRSVRSESQGDMGSFPIHRHGARVHGNLRI